MKNFLSILFLAFVFCTSANATVKCSPMVAVSPGPAIDCNQLPVVPPDCPPVVAIGGGIPNSCFNFPESPDSRRDSIVSYFNSVKDQPKIFFAAMEQFNVTAAEVTNLLAPQLNFVHYMRINGAPNGLGGLKVWNSLEIDQYLVWAGKASYLDFDYERMLAQDVLDQAELRTKLYIDSGMDPTLLTPWKTVK